VEVRLYAEDVAAGFIPVSGTLTTLQFPEFDGVRVDAGFMSGSIVSMFYDPMLAKVIGYGSTRDEACSRLARALRETRVHGVITNRDLLIGILGEPEFRLGAIDTGYLERHDPARLMADKDEGAAVCTHALVAAVAAQAGRRSLTAVLPGLPSGWRSLPSQDQTVSFVVGDDTVDVSYRFDRGRISAVVDEQSRDVRIRAASATLVDAEIDGVRRRYRVSRCGATHYVDSALGSTALTEVDRFPDPSSRAEVGSLLAPMPGTVVRVEATEGAEVTAGTPIVVLEAMKMEHSVRAPGDGTVTTILVSEGQQVDSGAVLAVVHGDEQ
jgi:acetyl/propionyl-CoA carboxylase alpha subunit